jgi:hypothetical protein
MFDGGHGWGFFGVMSTIATWVTGLLLFLIWLTVVILFVRFLLIATRAAKVYLRNNGEADGVLPPRVMAPAAPVATTTATAPTKPTPRTPRTP